MKTFITLVSSLLISMSVHAADAGSKAPTFAIKSLKNVDTPTIDFESYKGKVVYVDFWASWCGPCKRSFPMLETLRSKYNDRGFEVIAINMDENIDDANNFLGKFPASFPIGTDPAGKVAEQYGLKGLPTAYIIDRQGVINHIVVGFDDKSEYETIEAVTNKLLGAQ